MSRSRVAVAAARDLFSLAGILTPLGISPEGVIDGTQKESVFVDAVIFGLGFREWDQDSESSESSALRQSYLEARSEGYGPLDAAVMAIPELEHKLRPDREEREWQRQTFAAAARVDGWACLSAEEYLVALERVIGRVAMYIAAFEDETDDHARKSSRRALYALSPSRLDGAIDLEEAIEWALPELSCPKAFVADWRLKGDTERNRLKNANRLEVHAREREQKAEAEAAMPKPVPPPGGFRTKTPTYAELGIRIGGSWESTWSARGADRSFGEQAGREARPRPDFGPLPMIQLKGWIEAAPKHQVEVKEVGRCDYFLIRDHGSVLEVHYRNAVADVDAMDDCVVLEQGLGWNRTRIAGWCRGALKDPMLGMDGDVFDELRQLERFGVNVAPWDEQGGNALGDAAGTGVHNDDGAGLTAAWLAA